jgi:mannose-6-phosphate isomerase-like protein (cupin superfamily)
MKPLLPRLAFAFLALSAASAAPISVSYAPPRDKTPMGTTFAEWEALVPKFTPVGQARAVFEAPTPTLEKFEVHVTTLRPGMISHPVHHHPWEEMLLIKEGSLDVSINGQIHRAGPGYLVFFASHDPHNIKNSGDVPATYYVINFYTDLVHTVGDVPASQRPAPGILPSSVIDCQSLPSTPTPTGSRISVVNSRTLTFERLESHITTLNAGASTQSGMRDSGDEFFVLKSGVIEATVNGVGCMLKAGSCFYCAPNDRRTFRNIGATPASYQVFKVLSDKSPAQPAA